MTDKYNFDFGKMLGIGYKCLKSSCMFFKTSRSQIKYKCINILWALKWLKYFKNNFKIVINISIKWYNSIY